MPGVISSARIAIDSKRPEQAGADREDQIERADVFVVGREKVAPPAVGWPWSSCSSMGVGLVLPQKPLTDAISLGSECF